MHYESLTPDEEDEMKAVLIHGWEEQHCKYGLQVMRLKKLVEGLPTGDWPNDINYLKGKGREEIVQLAQSKKHMELAQQYCLRDFEYVNMEVAIFECAKVENFHMTDLSGLPVERRAKAIAASREKRLRAENAQLGKTNSPGV